MIQNTCQVCGKTIYPEPINSVRVLTDEESYETLAFITVGMWKRNVSVCPSCGKRLIAEIESFFGDGKEYLNLTLGDLQKRLDSLKDD